MEIIKEIKENGKICIQLIKHQNTIYGKHIKFKSNKVNMFLAEVKINSPMPEQRKFIISIRQDGYLENSGEFKLSQMDFNKNELIRLRDNINEILEYQ